MNTLRADVLLCFEMYVLCIISLGSETARQCPVTKSSFDSKETVELSQDKNHTSTSRNKFYMYVHTVRTRIETGVRCDKFNKCDTAQYTILFWFSFASSESQLEQAPHCWCEC